MFVVSLFLACAIYGGVLCCFKAYQRAVERYASGENSYMSHGVQGVPVGQVLH